MSGYVSTSHGGGSTKLVASCFGLKLVVRTVLLVLLFVFGLCADKPVEELKKGTIEQFLSGKLFVVTYVDSTGCSRCRNLYPFFYAASQSFHGDQDIYFTRTYDKQLIQEWEVTELPALIYHKKGVDPGEVYGARGILSSDLTVDDIIQEIERVLHGDFESVQRKYAVHLDSHNFHEMITTPTQSVIMLLYDSKSKEKTMPVMEDVAYAFRKDDGLLVAMLNTDEYQHIRDQRFKVRESPAVMWLGEKDKKNPKRFGGMLAKELVVTFINEMTGLHRQPTGALEKEAGRIHQVDDILEEHADILFKADPSSLAMLSDAIKKEEPNVLAHQTPYLQYYLLVLDEIVKSGGAFSAFEDQVMNIEAVLYGNEELTPKTQDKLKKQINIIEYFKKVVKSFRIGEWQKSPGRSVDADSTVTLETKHHAHEEL